MSSADEQVREVTISKGSAKGRIARRVLGARGSEVARQYLDYADFTTYQYLTRRGRQNQQGLLSFRDRHVGETAVIIGNGPSLNDTDMNLIRDLPTFGLNRIYLMFDKIGFRTTYHVVVNRLVVEQCATELQALTMPRFSTRPNASWFRDDPDVNLLQVRHGLDFSQDIRKGIWEGATVTYVAMQLAFFMGFSRVLLVGVDHKFAVSGEAHKIVESTQSDASHFDPAYFGKGFRWQLPDLETSELAYRLARHSFETAGREIVDCTVGGALQIFPKRSLADCLR